VPWAQGRDLVEWARRADARGFSTLCTIGRIAYPGHDELTALAAAAAVTERIGLMTNILLAPLYNPVLLAKQAATVESLSGGRFTLGIAVGGRQDDYDVVGATFSDRGARLDEALEVMTAAWRSELVSGASRPVTPPLPRADGVPLMFGGTGPKAIQRVVRHGIGWTAGGAPPEAAGGFARQVREAWAEAGRDGEPHIAALAYFGLGDQAADGAGRYLMDYYAFVGDTIAKAIAGSALISVDAIRSTIGAFTDAGVDELMLCGTIPEPDQVDLLADAALA
jgi:alkanesulfonate monooxygenase SsuD/methylene tetrahydromethanopterin reductase-like flavin-dependent oxidoreductase (luciferase family)